MSYRFGWLARTVLGALIVLSVSGCAATSLKPTKISIPTATPGAIQLVTNQTRYATSDPIGVTLLNNGKSVVYARNNQFACTFVQIQRYDTGHKQWSTLGGCSSLNAPQPLVINPGAREPFTLAPGTQGNGNTWDSGTYRIALTYSASADGTTAPVTAYSAGFIVQ